MKWIYSYDMHCAILANWCGFFECGLFFDFNQMANSNTKSMCQCHGYQSFLIIIQLNIYAQTHTEKFVSITKISAYKLDKHAVICCQKLKLKVHGIPCSLLYISFSMLSGTFMSTWEKYEKRQFERRDWNKKKGNIKQVGFIVKASSLNWHLFNSKALTMNSNNCSWMVKQ